MICKVLVAGDRATFTTLSFDPEQKQLNVLADYTAPYNASWVEPLASSDGRDVLLGLSEGDESGSLYSFEIDHDKRKLLITSQQPTLAAPAHCEKTAIIRT